MKFWNVNMILLIFICLCSLETFDRFDLIVNVAWFSPDLSFSRVFLVAGLGAIAYILKLVRYQWEAEIYSNKECSFWSYIPSLSYQMLCIVNINLISESYHLLHNSTINLYVDFWSWELFLCIKFLFWCSVSLYLSFVMSALLWVYVYLRWTSYKKWLVGTYCFCSLN